MLMVALPRYFTAADFNELHAASWCKHLIFLPKGAADAEGAEAEGGNIRTHDWDIFISEKKHKNLIDNIEKWEQRCWKMQGELSPTSASVLISTHYQAPHGFPATASGRA